MAAARAALAPLAGPCSRRGARCGLPKLVHRRLGIAGSVNTRVCSCVAGVDGTLCEVLGRVPVGGL